MSLKIGDIVPNFTAKDNHGDIFESQSKYFPAIILKHRK